MPNRVYISKSNFISTVTKTIKSLREANGEPIFLTREVKLIIQSTVDMPDANGRAWIHYAVMYNNFSFYMLLDRMSADKRTKCSKGLTADDYIFLRLAKKINDFSFCISNISTLEMHFMRNNKLHTCQEGWSLLHYAHSCNNTLAIKILLLFNYNRELRDNINKKPIDYAPMHYENADDSSVINTIVASITTNSLHENLPVNAMLCLFNFAKINNWRWDGEPSKNIVRVAHNLEHKFHKVNCYDMSKLLVELLRRLGIFATIYEYKSYNSICPGRHITDGQQFPEVLFDGSNRDHSKIGLSFEHHYVVKCNDIYLDSTLGIYYLSANEVLLSFYHSDQILFSTSIPGSMTKIEHLQQEDLESLDNHNTNPADNGCIQFAYSRFLKSPPHTVPDFALHLDRTEFSGKKKREIRSLDLATLNL